MRLPEMLLASCGVLYAALAAVIALRSRRLAPLLLGGCCAVTSGWAWTSFFIDGDRLTGIEGGADLLRALAWFGFLFYLYRDARFARPTHEASFAIAGLTAGLVGAVAVLMQPGISSPGVPFSTLVMARLGIAVVELLLIENLYLNLPEHSRWHVALPSVLLGGLACFDIVLCADAALFDKEASALTGARTVGMILIGPLLVVAAARGQRWKGRVRMSRSAAFHSATLVLSGGVLLALALAGELVRYLNDEWGWLAEASMAFAALIAIGLVLTSGSARSRIHRRVVDNFFAERYDYRRQWVACMRSLSGDGTEGHGTLPLRAIRTIVSVVDSPAGALLLRDSGTGPFTWAGSWNLPAIDSLPAAHPIVAATLDGTWIPRLDREPALMQAPLDALGPLWLAVPLLNHGTLTGLVLVVPPRAPFSLENEVFELLRIVAQEVATYINEQRATQTLLQTRDLHDYGKRFAFVAHDIKNVSSQLSLLHANAQTHIDNPEFQKDLLDTVESSVRKITALLRRLEQPAVDRAPSPLAPLPVVEALVTTYRRVRKARLVLQHDGSVGTVAMGVDAFETAMTHLLNNAVEAAERATVMVRIRHEARRVVVEVVDSGPGMEPEFVRDELFHPFSTAKPGGSGIGAYQARELVREAGGDIEVNTAPGAGTTMRLLLPRTDGPAAARPAMEARVDAA